MNSLPILFVLFLQQSPYFAQADSIAQLNQNTNKDIELMPNTPFVKNYPASVFQSHNQVWSIAEDQRGMIFFGTGNGWLEFDGARWLHTNTNHPVQSLATDHHGILYLGLRNDFGRLLPNHKGKLVFQSLSDNLAENVRISHAVKNIRSTGQDMYFVTRYGSLFRWTDERLQPIRMEVGPYMSQVDDHVFVYNDAGIYILRGDRSVLLPQTQSLSKKDQVLCALPYQSQKLLIATERKGFFLYSLGPKKDGAIDIGSLPKLTGKRIQVFETPVVEYLKQHGLTRGLRLANGNYAFGTQQGGLVIMGPDGQRLMIIDKTNGLIDNYVRDLHQDRASNLWVATNNGISYVELSSPLIHFEDGTQTGFTLKTTRYQDRLFVGGFTGTSYHAGYDKQHRPVFVPIHEVTSSCWDMLVHRDHLLLGVEFGLMVVEGTQVVDQLKTKLIVYSLGSSARFPQHVFVGFLGGFSALTLEEGHQGDTKIRLLDKQQGDFAKITGEIRKIVADPEGNLWLTDLNGQILYLRFNSDKVSDFDVFTYDQQHGLPETSFNMVHFIDGRLVVGTRSGIYKMTQDSSQTDPASFSFALEDSFGQQPNLAGLRAHQIYKDKSGRIWINSLTSISRLTRRPNGSYEWNRLYFKKIDSGIEFMFFDKNDMVWFTNTKGLYLYDQNLEPKEDLDFRALISRVSVQNGLELFQGVHCQTDIKPGSVCKRPTLEQNQAMIIDLSYENNSLIFEFGATAYERPELNRYRIKLEGYDKKWSNWSERSLKEYTSLAEGNYRFRVLARNIYEHPGREASYAFRILPPWYRAYWAYTAYLILSAGLLLVGFRIYNWRLLAAKRRLERIVKERTAEVVRQKEEIQKKSEQIKLTYDVGRMEVANTMLHNVGNVLNSVNASIYCINRTTAKSRSRILSKAADLLADRQEDLEATLKDYPKERKILTSLPKIAEAWDAERKQIREQTDELNQGMELINNMVKAQHNLSREANRAEEIDLSRLLDDALNVLKVFLKDSSATIEMPSKKPPIVMVNRVQITHVLINLIKNAKEAVEQNDRGNRRIEIVIDQITEDDQEFVTVRISDNGPGLSQDNLEKITTFGFTTKKQGNGYGLHFCDQVMKSMGGALRIDSDGPGQGASFTLLFPLGSG